MKGQAWARLFSVTQCRSQGELGKLLGISQTAVSDAKRRNNVPAEWLITLLELKGINPGWIRTGKGPQYLVPLFDERSIEFYPLVDVRPPNEWSSEDLVDELVRRTLARM